MGSEVRKILGTLFQTNNTKLGTKVNVIRNYNKLKFKKADRNHKKQNPGKNKLLLLIKRLAHLYNIQPVVVIT